MPKNIVTREADKPTAVEFINSLNSQQFGNIQKFFVTMPKLKHDVKVKNPHTQVESDVTLEGLQSFF